VTRTRLIFCIGVTALVGGLLVFAGPSRAEPQFSVINTSGYAAADHVVAGNDAFPNFATGAVDNRYPLAFARVDNVSAEGLASPADTGPIGQTEAASQSFQQPQYADAKYPPAGPAQSVGSPNGPYAVAHAANGDGYAQGQESSVPFATAHARAASIARLNASLLAWRARFLTADDARRHPFVAGTASEPDGADGLYAVSHATFAPATGTLQMDADSRVARASFGGGAIVFHGVHMHVTVINTGTPKHTITVDVGSASIGGIPVTVGAEGVSVAGQQLPGIAQALDQANAQLNAALQDAGFRVFVVRPAITTAPNSETIEASALTVQWQGGAVAPGVPRSFVGHDLGEAFAFSLATPSPAVTVAVPAAPVVSGPTAPTTRFVPGTPATPGSAGTPAGQITTPPSAAPRALGAVAHKPLWLVLLYFAWQCAVLGTIASLWLWRRAGA
jgi:hypothetical protein